MFYVSSKHNNEVFGITDTKDGVEEYYSVYDIVKIMKTFKVK